MVSLNFLSHRVIALFLILSSAIGAQAQSQQVNFSEENNVGFWAVAGLLAALGAWWLGRRESAEAIRLLEDQKKKLEALRNDLESLKTQLKSKDDGIEVLEKKLSNALALKDQVVADSFSRDQFVAMVSQQMREPLNEITSSLRALSKESDDEVLQDHLYEIENATNDLVVFINDILDQCKVEAGKVVLEERKFDVRELVETVKDQMEADSPCSICSSDIQIHPRVPVSLVGDTVRLRQILSNLFQAVYASGKVSDVSFSVAPQDLFLRNATLKFTIEGMDNGKSTEAEKFESFVTNESPLLKNTERLVRLQNGKMTVKSGHGVNLLIQVWLPFRLPGTIEKSNTPVAKRTREIVKNLEGYQVLVAEDNRITQVVVAKVLKDRGAEVVTVMNGAEAVKLVEERNFDLIIMDINMPVLDGYQAVSKIRRMEQGKENKVPIIALTSSVLLTTKEKAMLHGMDEYVGKPFSIDDLMDKVSFCLSESKKV